MCPEASASENPECINCRTKAECAQNALCCRSSCNAICKTPVNSKALSSPGSREGPAGSRVCLKRTHRPLHPCTSSVRPTHLPEPPCNLLANLGPEVSGLPRVLPNTRGRTSAKTPSTEWDLFSQGVSKVDSAKLGRERALGGKRVTISPQLMLQRLATAPGIQST